MEANCEHKNELLIRIDERYPKFSKGQKRLADYIKENYDKATFLTAAKMGEAVGVSESTVVRFATQLGYKGYPEFQKALGELVRTKLNSIQRMEVTYGRIDRSEILATVLQSDIEKIKQTLESVDNHAFELAVDTILAAKKVYVIGIRSCAPLAKFLTFYLNLICEDVVEVDTNSSSEIFEQTDPDRGRRCDHRDQFSAIFHAYFKSTGICQQPESKGNNLDRQCEFTDESLFLLQSDRQE